jgi:hypothetical protein
MRALVLAVVLFAVLAAPAAAKVWFLEMRGDTVRWGQRVTTTISGCPGNPSCGNVVRGLRVSMRRVSGGRLFSLGTIDGEGRLRFRVPRAAPAQYRLIYEAANGRRLQASEAFRVTRPG